MHAKIKCNGLQRIPSLIYVKKIHQSLSSIEKRNLCFCVTQVICIITKSSIMRLMRAIIRATSAGFLSWHHVFHSHFYISVMGNKIKKENKKERKVLPFFCHTVYCRFMYLKIIMSLLLWKVGVLFIRWQHCRPGRVGISATYF